MFFFVFHFFFCQLEEKNTNKKSLEIFWQEPRKCVVKRVLKCYCPSSKFRCYILERRWFTLVDPSQILSKICYSTQNNDMPNVWKFLCYKKNFLTKTFTCMHCCLEFDGERKVPLMVHLQLYVFLYDFKVTFIGYAIFFWIVCRFCHFSGNKNMI